MNSLEPNSLPSESPLVSDDSRFEDVIVHGVQLLIFVRHAGCTFCRETLHLLSERLTELRNAQIEPLVVHMSPLEEGSRLLMQAGLHGVKHISDPSLSLYRRYGLKRGKLSQLLGPRVWWKGFLSAIVRGHGFGKIKGDGTQLGGSVLLRDGKTVHVFPTPDATTTIPSLDALRKELALP